MVRLLFLYGFLSCVLNTFAQPTFSPDLDQAEFLLVINDQVYVAGYSTIYKLDSNTLKISNQSNTIVGKPTLFAEYINGSGSVLICKNEGTCETFRLNDLARIASYPSIGPLSQEHAYSLAMIQSTHNRSSTDIVPNAVYMVHTPVGSNLSSTGLGLVIRNPTNFSLYTLPPQTVWWPASIPSIRSYKADVATTDLEYLHMYSYEKMKFIVKNWIPDSQGRIGALCENDVLLKSYIEMNVECGDGYGYIQAVFTTDDIGDDIKSILQKPNTRGSRAASDYYVFLVMARSKESSISRLCGFHAETLRATFEDKYVGCQINGTVDTTIGPDEWATTEDRCTPGPSYNRGLSMCQLIDANIYNGFTFSPVYVSAPKDAVHLANLDSKVVAVVVLKGTGSTIAVTNDGDHTIRKVFIGQTVDNSRIYQRESEGISGPLQPSLALNQGKIYTLNNQRVYKLDLYACESATNCERCIAKNDPFCGWCALSMSCTMVDTCPWSSSTSDRHWLQTQCMEPSIDDDDKYISVEQISTISPKKIRITANFLPVILPGSSTYKCCFSLNSPTLCSDGTVESFSTGSAPDVITIDCPLPRTVPIPSGQGETLSTLELKLDGNTFVKDIFTFYNCSAFSTCTSCASAEMIFTCKWCLTNSICTANGEDFCDPGERLVTNQFDIVSSLASPEHCPRIESVTDRGREPVDFYIVSGSNVENGSRILFIFLISSLIFFF